MKARCRFKHVKWVDHTDKERWDQNESVKFTKDEPGPGGDFWMPKAYTQADHIINLCLMKSHGCGITGAMKNHFGSIPSPRNLHDGMGDKSYIADVCNTPSIRKKVRVNIADALFATWHNNVWAYMNTHPMTELTTGLFQLDLTSVSGSIPISLIFFLHSLILRAL